VILRGLMGVVMGLLAAVDVRSMPALASAARD
jgi:hypothetical protein